MKLYVTWTSPYARVVRMAVLEKALQARIEVVEARTRTQDSAYYALNPSGRVPYLVRDDSVGIEDSSVIVAYLDQLAPEPRLVTPWQAANWSYGRLEAYARSMTDGISVWVREMRRPEGERSPTILAHELARAERLADFWEREIGHALMQGDINLAQLLLLAGLDFAAHWDMGQYAQARPRLAAWLARMHARDAVLATAPPRKA
ncbi:MAG: glutathione S-transferase family protein [Hyphomicrobiaceae bacterium]